MYKYCFVSKLASLSFLEILLMRDKAAYEARTNGGP